MVHLLNIPSHFKVDKLANRHTSVDSDRLGTRYFKSPGIAKSNIPFACCGVNINSQASYRGFSLQERYVTMSFGIFFGNPQIEGPGVEDQPFRGYGELFHRIVNFGVQNSGVVDCEEPAQMDVVGVGAQTLPVKGFDQNMTLLNSF